MSKQWVHQHGKDNEVWHCYDKYETKEEAIIAGKREAIEYGADCFQIGKVVPASPNPPDAENMISNALDDLYDQIGEAAESWEPSDEQTSDLQNRLETLWSEWINEHDLAGVCFAIVDVTDHKVELEDTQ